VFADALATYTFVARTNYCDPMEPPFLPCCGQIEQTLGAPLGAGSKPMVDTLYKVVCMAKQEKNGYRPVCSTKESFCDLKREPPPYCGRCVANLLPRKMKGAWIRAAGGSFDGPIVPRGAIPEMTMFVDGKQRPWPP